MSSILWQPWFLVFRVCENEFQSWALFVLDLSAVRWTLNVPLTWRKFTQLRAKLSEKLPHKIGKFVGKKNRKIRTVLWKSVYRRLDSVAYSLREQNIIIIFSSVGAAARPLMTSGTLPDFFTLPSPSFFALPPYSSKRLFRAVPDPPSRLSTWCHE